MSTAWIAAIVSTIERLACHGPPRTGPLGGLAVAHDVPVDEAHHVERCAVHREVVAEALDRRHRNGGALQCGEDPVLAAHVVGAREHVAERRPTQHECGAGRRR
jgi:hypothetical protein